MTKPKRDATQPGPFYIFGTFAYDWTVLTVEVQGDFGLPRTEYDGVTTMRLVDAPYTELTEAWLDAHRIRRAYTGRNLAVNNSVQRDENKRRVKAVHVDRNPPGYDNRWLVEYEKPTRVLSDEERAALNEAIARLTV